MAGGRTHGAHGLFSGEKGGPRLGSWPIDDYANRSRACRTAMLHPGHHLLADITPLFEIDAVQMIHVGLMRKRIAVHEVEPTARNAGGDAVRLVSSVVHQLRTDQVGDFLRELLRCENPPAER